LSTLLPIREGASDASIGDTPAFQEDIPVNQDMEPASSLADIVDVPGKELADADANRSLQAAEGTGQLGVDESMPSATDGNTPAQGDVTGARVSDTMHHSESSFTDPQTLTIQPDAAHTIDLTSLQSSRRIESGVFERSGQVGGQVSMPDNSAGKDEAERALADGGRASIKEPDMTQEPAGTIIPDSRMDCPEGPDHGHLTASSQMHGPQNRTSGHEETEPASSPAGIRDMPGNELTGNGDDPALQAVEGTGRLGASETMLSPAEGNTPAQGEVAGVVITDDRYHSESSVKDRETLTIQADETHTIDLNSPQSSRRIESGVFEPSGQSSRQASMPDSYAGANEVETASADGGKARQVSSSVDKQADLRNPSRQQDISRLKKPDETKGVPGDVRRVLPRATAVDSHVPSDGESALVGQSAGKKASTSARSLGSGPSKPGSPIQHIAGPAMSSASPEALRSVPARPFLTDLTPKGRDSFHSELPLRSPERRHEAPKVQIGQIDVIVEAARPATKPAPAPSPVDLASRHYLRRL
jgi:hypothetical protein